MKNDYKILGETTEIYCNHRGGIVPVLVSTIDLPCIQEHLNSISIYRKGDSKIYAKSTLKRVPGAGQSRKVVLLHRFITGTSDPNIPVDHINRDTLNNTRGNLRECTHVINCRNKSPFNPSNSSGHRGVHFQARANKWKATIGVDNEHIYLGTFVNLEDALQARKQAEIKYWGDER